MRNWLREQGREQEQVTKTMARLAQVLPWPTHENREAWSSYVPHTQAILEFEGQCINERSLWTVLLYTGQRTSLTRKYAEAEVFCKKAVDLAKAFGPDHPDTLDSINNLALVLRQQGKHTEAEQMHQQRLAWKDGGRLRKAEDERGDEAVTSVDSCAAPRESQSNRRREPPDGQAEPESKRQCIR